MVGFDRDRPSARAALVVVGAIVMGVALIGFAVGTRPETPPPAPRPEPTTPAAYRLVPEARSYTELRRAPPIAAEPWDRRVQGGPPPAGAGVEPADREAALAVRAARRAYDGAPPVIPHPVRQREAPACLACHEDGIAIRGRVARPMSHPTYASCTQCHVVDEGPVPTADWLPPGPPAEENGFAGLPSPKAGPRAWPVAPPQIPHRTFMREQCMSCHGPYGAAPLRTSHPERQSCTQCHAPAAGLDQRFTELEPVR